MFFLFFRGQGKRLEATKEKQYAKGYSNLKKMDIEVLKETKWAFDFTKRNQ